MVLEVKGGRHRRKKGNTPQEVWTSGPDQAERGRTGKAGKLAVPSRWRGGVSSIPTRI